MEDTIEEEWNAKKTLLVGNTSSIWSRQLCSKVATWSFKEFEIGIVKDYTTTILYVIDGELKMLLDKIVDVIILTAKYDATENVL